jgi:hypothetical protein
MNLMPLNGMQVRLERASDMPLDNYCTTLAVIRVEEGVSRAELRCAICGRHRCWLSAEVAKWMLAILKCFPAARNETFVLQDTYENREHDSEQDADADDLRCGGKRQDDAGLALP